MATSFDVIYLGTLPIIDPYEGNATAENAAALVGTTVGTADNPLAFAVKRFDKVSTNVGDYAAYETDNRYSSDTFRIDGGSTRDFDAMKRYEGTLTYTDGTTATGTFVVFQDTAGNTYLAPELSQTTTQTALEAKPIQSFTFDAVDPADYNMAAERDPATFTDGGMVQGTDANNSMTDGFTDSDGDRINLSDNTIYGLGGDDYIDAVGGNDTVFGGTGRDYLRGGTGNDTLFGDAGDDSVFGNEGSDTIYGGLGNDFLDDELGAENGISTDTFFGGDGNDTIYLGGGADIGYGGTGNDLVGGEEGDDLIYGGAGDDLVGGNSGNDTVYGDSGRDNVFGDGGDDTLFGGADGDVLLGGDGNDTLSGDAGADSLDGGNGSDTLDYATNTAATSVNLRTNVVSGGEATGDVIANFESVRGSSFSDSLTLSDTTGTITAGAGNDTLTGGAGNDTLFGGDGSDLARGGGGNDVLEGGAGNDTLYGEAGNDTLSLDLGNDTAFGGQGSDLFNVDNTVGTVSIVGGEDPDNTDTDSLQLSTTGGGQPATVMFTGNESGTFSFGGGGGGTFSEIEWIDASEAGDMIDARATTTGGTISGYLGDDTILGGSGNDELSGDAGADSIDGGAGDDFLDGGDGADLLAGGIGNDTLVGAAGDDVLRGGAGNDQLSGGVGNDTFVLDQAGGADMVTDFDLGDADADGFYNDQLDVTDLRTPDGAPVTAFDVVVVDDGFGNAKLIFPEGETVVLEGVSPAQMSTAGQRYSAGIPCFTPGTMILTPAGERPVELLRPGDLVVTRDNGPQRLVWVGMRRLDTADLVAAPHLRPIRIAPGAFGNDRALTVSPQHGMLLTAPGGQGTRLVRAKHLADMKGGQARVMHGARHATYVHLMCETHQVVISNGIPSESFYPGPQALAMLHIPELCELLTLFPDLRQGALTAIGPTARPVLRRSALPNCLSDMRAAPL